MAGLKKSTFYTVPGAEPYRTNTLLSGPADPTAEDGADGDFWINTELTTLFGPKTDGAWGAGVALVGPAGADGAQGPQGDPGLTGATELTGLTDVAIGAETLADADVLVYNAQLGKWVNVHISVGFGGGVFGGA